jgi:hypothetical protein
VTSAGTRPFPFTPAEHPTPAVQRNRLLVEPGLGQVFTGHTATAT